ncbi:delta-60 repeat domain-containing protein [Flavobacterium sp.]|uniref:delta-60 repeat domain-containing protein n=1 Tax=Flavobacterium sp. TaxID=239 RepID=UPI003752C9A4
MKKTTYSKSKKTVTMSFGKKIKEGKIAWNQFLKVLIVIMLFVVANAKAQTQINNYAFNNTVTAIAKASDGSTYVGGAFTSVGEYCGTAVKLTSNTTSTFNINDVKVLGTVNVIVPNPIGGWYIGGSFTSINGVVRNGLAQINADGSLNSFNPNVNGQVLSIVINSSGKIYIGGSFTNVGPEVRSNFACLNSDGTIDALNLTK